jgi:hypothetical protein
MLISYYLSLEYTSNRESDESKAILLKVSFFLQPSGGSCYSAATQHLSKL